MTVGGDLVTSDGFVTMPLLASTPGPRPTRLEVGRTPVTQLQFEAALGYAPSHFAGSPNAPVESVSFHEAAALCNAASGTFGAAPCFTLDGHGRNVTVVDVDQEAMASGAVRLLTAEEWEWACLAGTECEYWWGSSRSSLDDHSWWRGNSSHSTADVDAPGHTNEWGLSDMIGNVWEWCLPSSGEIPGRPDTVHPWKGGSWHTSNPADMAVRFVVGSDPGVRTPGLGFRLARGYLEPEASDQSSKSRDAADPQVNRDR